VTEAAPAAAPTRSLRLGTRGSLLARTQSQLVANALEEQHPGLRVELVILRTSGDQIKDRPLHEFGGKGLFTKELEQALLENAIDLAVHSYKDVPVTMPLVDQAGLVVAAVPAREDPRDVLAAAKATAWEDLPKGARVGTGSLRRRCQMLAARPDLKIEGVRGNIDTRLKKLADGEFDAIVLALAGLRRTTLFDEAAMTIVGPDVLLPAPGQGALALQCRKDDAATIELLGAINDPTTAQCVDAERYLVRALEGDCHSPIAALATLTGSTIQLRAAVGARDGKPPVIRAAASAAATDPTSAVDEVMRQLTRDGVEGLLKG
jgi:hydroxymethylbilane synthase